METGKWSQFATERYAGVDQFHFLTWSFSHDLRGAHASIPMFVFDKDGAPFDYSCTTSKSPGRRHLKKKESRRLKDHERRALYKEHSKRKLTYEDYTDEFYAKVTKSCNSCKASSMRSLLTNKLLDTKMSFLQKVMRE